MLFEFIFILTCLSESVKCSIVVDYSSQNQKGVFLTDYCPKMKYCAEGAHVMCMYYNPTSVMGPLCRNPRNVTLTLELANKLLDVSNAARSKIARGQEKGKNGKHFPRGYGIFRLKWDNELATFAQVMANQCVLRHDMCRATKRFPDPGQTAGLVRFSDPDWIPISKFSNITRPGLDREKLMYATTQSLKFWYGQKGAVTIQMLSNYPDFDSMPNKQQNGRLYLEMIYGPSTHMGCGISAYNEYAFYDNNASLSYNSVHVICNYSGRPRNGGAVYNTVPPTDSATTFNQCGCPAGSVEDDDCLCHEMPMDSSPESQVQLPNGHKTRKCEKSMNCDPTVVLLPIFTVEDAPPDKLIYPERFANSSFGQIRSMVPDSFEELLDNNVSGNRRNMHDSSAMEDHSSKGTNGKQQRAVTHNHVSVRQRHFDKPKERKTHDNRKENEDRKTRKSISNHISRPSIFAKTPRFELPGTRNFLKIDVVPRKDFSKGKKLVGKYLYSKKSIVIPAEGHGFPGNYQNTVPGINEVNSAESLNRDLQKYLHPKIRKRTKVYHKDVQFNDILTTETVLNTAEERVINHNTRMKDLNMSHDFNKIDAKTATTEENDKKLMALLDTLEQEVKHIELRDKEKQIFDAKLKKIYGKIVGDKTLGSNEKIHEAKPNKNHETKNESTYETKRKTKHKIKHEIKPQTKDVTKHEPKHDSKHEPTHEATHMDIDLDSIEHGNDSKDHHMISVKDHDNLSDDDNSVHNLEPSHDKLKYETDISDLQNSHREPHDDIHDIETEGFEKYPKHDTQSTDIELDELNKRAMSKNHKGNYKNGDKTRLRYRQNLRHRNNNDLDSLEYIRHTYIDNGYRARKYNNNRHYERSVLRNDVEKPKHRSNSLNYKFGRRRNIYGNDAWYEDPLSAERRKYYQDKLDDMERKLQNVRHSARKKDSSRPRHLRAMRPSVRSDNQMDSLYTAGRARFLHGY